MTLSIVQVPNCRDPKLGRIRAPWGFLLHTTGGGITDKAKRTGTKPIDVAIAAYIEMQNGSEGYTWGGPSYVIDFDGLAYQVAPDEVMTAHAGGGNRDAYFDGSWATRFPEATAQWRARWPTYKHPYELFPTTSPNGPYIGCEMIPIGDGFGGSPMTPGLRFTAAQHETAVALGLELGARHGWPAGWGATSRLLGHEDVDPIERSDVGGGWDPGSLRAAPYFDMSYVRSRIAAG
jgi:hypothetical protein